MRFIKGSTYRISWTINGEVRISEVVFTGEGVTVGNEEFGKFENVNSGKAYFLSKEGFAKLQGEEWAQTVNEW